ncbi:MAG: Hsp33 family molecular chaperone HslO [Clostridiales bacterium]|nr:Hsp33 family molecular chaperone HslO [Clostridiales bacterium]
MQDYQDYIVRATAGNNQIRAFAATTRDMVEAARVAHNSAPVATAALGRLLTGGAMMGVMMKGEKDLLTIQIKCTGPMKGLTVTADSHGNVKGYAIDPTVMLPPNYLGKLDVGAAIDQGMLSVIKDMGLKEPYVGQVQLTTAEIADDLTYYFASSEQVPSSVGLGVLMNKNNTVKQAGGFIIQLMPFADDDIVNRLEEKINSIDSVTAMLDKEMTPEDILSYILGEFDLEILDTMPTRFHCDCSKERIERAIVSLGRNEIEKMVKDNEPIQVHCHFCNKDYTFSTEELKAILKRK